MGGRAGDWIEVDSLADLWARGHPRRAVPLGRARAARLLAASPASGGSWAPRWRRSRTACPRASAPQLAAAASQRAFDLIGPLMGDAEADGPEGALLGHPRVDARRRRGHRPICSRDEAAIAVAGDATAPAPGSSAMPWPASRADPGRELRARLAGLRRDRRRPPSTSAAAALGARFAALVRSHLDAAAIQGDRYAEESRMTDPVGGRPLGPHRGGAQVGVPRLRHERHRQPRPARRARRPQAGAPPHPLHDERDGPRLRRPPTASAPPSSATSWASTTRTATRPSTTPSCAWPRTSRCATRSSTARATSARSTATRRPPCATPRRA